MKNLILIISLLGLAFFAQAAVYKHVDDEGNVIKYADVPQHPGDKPINVPPPAMEFESKTPPAVTTFESSSSSSKQKAESEDRKPVTAYSAVTIMNIEDDQGVRANGGVFQIILASQPALDADAGHRYAVLINGKVHQKAKTAEFELKNLERGTQHINVQVQDRDGSVLASSIPITMHVLRR